ncbi:unannotated protein [freshwater metagenome]|uniref:Unannotated protein n=1 Tax=freshwater metagenome TaxID=449393 RepID=A0A6J7HDE4_9ZZZZ
MLKLHLQRLASLSKKLQVSPPALEAVHPSLNLELIQPCILEQKCTSCLTRCGNCKRRYLPFRLYFRLAISAPVSDPSGKQAMAICNEHRSHGYLIFNNRFRRRHRRSDWVELTNHDARRLFQHVTLLGTRSGGRGHPLRNPILNLPETNGKSSVEIQMPLTDATRSPITEAVPKTVKLRFMPLLGSTNVIWPVTN